MPQTLVKSLIDCQRERRLSAQATLALLRIRGQLCSPSSLELPLFLSL